MEYCKQTQCRLQMVKHIQSSWESCRLEYEDEPWCESLVAAGRVSTGGLIQAQHLGTWRTLGSR